MTEPAQPSAPPAGDGRDRIFVQHESGPRPFMRGILVHSLMARGLSFDDALAAANETRARLRGRGVVRADALARIVDEVLEEGNLLEDARPPALAPAIRVTSPTGTAPFSKGFLSQSLLAAAIEPND